MSEGLCDAGRWIFGESDVPVMFNGGSPAARAYRVAGTAESWRG
jgi:hypothetical protein